ncbi:MAG: glycosyltransferase [Pirellulales bacterium]|nr:glycosyltransferase [Pirellulales bacterium]
MPRVLHLRTVTGHGGGPEKTLLNSPRFIDSEYELRLAYIRPAGDRKYDLPERAARLGVRLIDVPERGPADPRTLWRLAAAVRGFRPDILHPHDYKTNVLAVLLAKMFRLKVVTTLHGYVTVGGRLDWYYRIDRSAIRRMDHVVVVSDDLLEVVRQIGVPDQRVTLIENAIDAGEYRRRGPVAAAKTRLGVPSGRFVIGAVGRLAPEKGFEASIQALVRLVRDGWNAELWIAGDGDEREHLARLAAELNLSERVRLLGHRTDLIDLYQAFDVFVLSSLREGLPNVLLEALATEVPVVATNVAGVPRLIENGQSGFIVRSGKPEELSAAISLLLGDEPLRLRFAKAGRETIEQRYNFRVRMEKEKRVYDAVLGRTISQPRELPSQSVEPEPPRPPRPQPDRTGTE